MKKNYNIKITVLDYAILGILSKQALSGYAIRKVFEKSAMGNYSDSPGTIYPALKRLENFNLIESVQEDENGKSKFHITSQGKTILRKWLINPIEFNDVMKNKDQLFLRFAFLDTLSDPKQTLTFLKSFRDLLIIYIDQLQKYYKKEKRNMPTHAKLSFKYGIESNETTLEWCKKALTLYSNKQSK